MGLLNQYSMAYISFNLKTAITYFCRKWLVWKLPCIKHGHTIFRMACMNKYSSIHGIVTKKNIQPYKRRWGYGV